MDASKEHMKLKGEGVEDYIRNIEGIEQLNEYKKRLKNIFKKSIPEEKYWFFE